MPTWSWPWRSKDMGNGFGGCRVVFESVRAILGRSFDFKRIAFINVCGGERSPNLI